MMGGLMRALIPARVQRQVLGTVQTISHRGPPEDPLVSAQNFLEAFEEAYGTVHPPFLAMSYRDALKASADQFKFLNTAKYCRDTLCSQTVVDFISDNMLFWAGDVRTPAANQ
eukprot:4308907-Pyramimonas_sp.AAC.1